MLSLSHQNYLLERHGAEEAEDKDKRMKRKGVTAVAVIDTKNVRQSEV